MGGLIGDALGLGCHWYYDVSALHNDCGEWITGYRDSDPKRTDRFGYIARFRHEAGLRAGDLSQTGQIARLLLESLAEHDGYQQADFVRRLDELFATLNGESLSGRYTDRAVCDTWKNRRSGSAWGAAGSSTDTAEAAIWGVALAANGDCDMRALAIEADRVVKLTHANQYIAGYSVAYILSAAALMNGVDLAHIREHMVSAYADAQIAERTSSIDIIFQIGNEAACMGADASLEIDPVVVCRLIGMNCTIGFLIPAAYFLIHRYPDDFEMAVLTAVNAGGNNMARAALVGALSGALVGIEGIPERFITGLRDHEQLLALADRVAR